MVSTIEKVLDISSHSGSFSEKKSEAMEYAKMYNCLPNKVEKIEERRKAEWKKEMELE